MTAGGDANTKTTVAAEHLRAVTERVFGARGVSAADVGFVTDVLVEANLRGHDSHGVVRVPKWVIGLESGAINARCAPRVIRETTNAVLVDDDRGLGPVVAKVATALVAEKARGAGIAMVSDPRAWKFAPDAPGGVSCAGPDCRQGVGAAESRVFLGLGAASSRSIAS